MRSSIIIKEECKGHKFIKENDNIFRCRICGKKVMLDNNEYVDVVNYEDD